MTLLVGSLVIGLILSLLALGIFISFRIFHFPDITADGSFTLGASVSAVMIVNGVNPLLATAIAFVFGTIAGSITGILNTKFKINNLLAGILVMTALYSVNLRIMGKSNIPLLFDITLMTYAESIGSFIFGRLDSINLFGWQVYVSDFSILISASILIGIFGVILYVFFRTNLGTAMRATGDNDQMIRALGVNAEYMVILGLALSNGLIAISGALLAQYQGFADVQMGIGVIVWGLASVIIGEALVGSRLVGMIIIGAVMGSVLFRLLVAIALRMGLNPNDLKLITAAFVFIALVLPGLLDRLKNKREKAANA
ncbi:ABC transporter permease [Desulfobacterota bacterium AH_259_B03_O07]|nr:ABC transporter permease [Desulfobacterota bacterium AH_259_B03_O07]